MSLTDSLLANVEAVLGGGGSGSWGSPWCRTAGRRRVRAGAEKRTHVLVQICLYSICLVIIPLAKFRMIIKTNNSRALCLNQKSVHMC
jgi:hypothetical protein